ncbi:MAG: hypothetical protein EA398_14505 [Deltaproteobacteria bacterium]|nr:MAG: hypothetical protein EA398_14505 [Deltaproteobacteria bacterium]
MSRIDDRDLARLNAYLEGELDDGERAALEAQLEARPELREELDGLRETVALFASLPEPEPPEDFDRAVQRRIRRRSRGRYFGAEQRRERLSQVAIPLAALIVLALIAFLLSPGRLEILLEPPAAEDAPDEAPAPLEDDPTPPDASRSRLPPTVEPAPPSRPGPAHRRIEYRYSVRATGESAAIEAELRRRFGARAVRAAEPADGGAVVEVAVERAQLGAALQRLEDLGPVERSRVEVDGAAARVTIRVVIDERP